MTKEKGVSMNAKNDLVEVGLFRQHLSTLSRRATIDKAFRALCLEDADKAYFELTGQVMPKQYIVRFFESEHEIPQNSTTQWIRLLKYLPETWLG